MRLLSSLTCLIALLGLINPASADDKVKVYTYHEKPPYYIQTDAPHQTQSSNVQGIYHEFVNYLNVQQSNKLYELHFMPRIRLENLLKEGQLDGLIIGVNPLWFKDKEQTRYLWTESMMTDKDIFLVNNESNIQTTASSDFLGLKFALSRGNYYKGITELIKQGKVRLAATNSAQQNFEMLAYHRADITIMSELTANYFFNRYFTRERFRILDTPHDTFERRILVPKNHKTVYKELSILVKKSTSDKAWQDRLEQWYIKKP